MRVLRTPLAILFGAVPAGIQGQSAFARGDGGSDRLCTDGDSDDGDRNGGWGTDHPESETTYCDDENYPNHRIQRSAHTAPAPGKRLIRNAATCVAVLGALVACNDSDTANTTTAGSTTISNTTTTEAPPTTPAPTPSAPPPTTGATSTAASSTTAAGDPIEAAKAEVAARYEEFSVVANECTTKPGDCDLPSVLGEYADPDAALYQLYENWWNDALENDEHVEALDLIERRVIDVQIADSKALVIACVVDGSQLVNDAGVVTDDSVGYRREETLWDKVGDDWRLTGGTTYRVTDAGDEACGF